MRSIRHADPLEIIGALQWTAPGFDNKTNLLAGDPPMSVGGKLLVRKRALRPPAVGETQASIFIGKIIGGYFHNGAIETRLKCSLSVP